MDFTFLIRKFTDFFITSISVVYFLTGLVFITKFQSNTELFMNGFTSLYKTIGTNNEFSFLEILFSLLTIFSFLYVIGSVLYGAILTIKSFFKSLSLIFLKKETARNRISKILKKISIDFFIENKEIKSLNELLLEGFPLSNKTKDSRNIIREFTNTDLVRYWSLDFLETNYKTYFSVSIVSIILGTISLYLGGNYSFLFFITAFLQYIVACDYRESFNYAFYSISRIILMDISKR